MRDLGKTLRIFLLAGIVFCHALADDGIERQGETSAILAEQAKNGVVIEDHENDPSRDAYPYFKRKA